MKEKRKNLLLAMLIAGIVIVVFGSIALYNLYSTQQELKEKMRSNSIGNMEDNKLVDREFSIQIAGSVSALMGFFIFLTIVFYFVIGYLRKRKK